MTEPSQRSEYGWGFEPIVGNSNKAGALQGADNSQEQSLHHSEKSVRDLVISKQHARVFPVQNRLMGRMEDQLVRWKRPPSSHVGTMQVIEGTHPFQQDQTSMAQTWCQIKDAFSVRMQKLNSDDTDEEDLEDIIFSDQGSPVNCHSTGNDNNNDSSNRDQYNAKTSKTTNAVPVTMRLPSRQDDLTINSRYTYHFPIPQYYLSQQATGSDENRVSTTYNNNSRQVEEGDDSFSYASWLCSPY